MASSILSRSDVILVVTVQFCLVMASVMGYFHSAHLPGIGAIAKLIHGNYFVGHHPVINGGKYDPYIPCLW